MEELSGSWKGGRTDFLHAIRRKGEGEEERRWGRGEGGWGEARDPVAF